MNPLANMGPEAWREAMKAVVSLAAGFVQLVTGVSVLQSDAFVSVLLFVMCFATALAGVAHMHKVRQRI